MTCDEQVPLAPFSTFRIGGPARYFCRIASEGDLREAVQWAQARELPLFVLGGGSNLLISDAGFAGLVVKMEQRGISQADRNHETFVSAAAGEVWDDLVKTTVERGLFGLENLSAIPGTVGAAPVQNIGAYGAEISQVIHKVRALDTRSLEFRDLGKDDCRYGYRDSLFKQHKGRYVITQVELRLNRRGRAHLDYQDLAHYFAKRGISAPTLGQVRNAVVEVRRGKLPDVAQWGTAGSFFKNPIVPHPTFEKLKQEHPGLPGHPEPDGRVKLPLGWILDKICKVRGFAIGNVSTYEKQALVVVAQPGASATEVVQLTTELRRRVLEATGLDIEAEVEWVG
jgi:UDP-N-acetylmuramate dehydrogenase